MTRSIIMLSRHDLLVKGVVQNDVLLLASQAKLDLRNSGSAPATHGPGEAIQKTRFTEVDRIFWVVKYSPLPA